MKHSQTAQFIIELAKKHNVVQDTTSAQHLLAKKFIELSDDEYLLDSIDQLIVALMKADAISDQEGLDLIIQYNKELQE